MKPTQTEYQDAITIDQAKTGVWIDVADKQIPLTFSKLGESWSNGWEATEYQEVIFSCIVTPQNKNWCPKYMAITFSKGDNEKEFTTSNFRKK